MYMANLIPLLFIIPLSFFLLSTLLFAAWVYKDAQAQGENGLMWLFIVILVPNALGIILYLLLVKREAKKICSNCGSSNPLNVKYCKDCGSDLEISRTEDHPGSRLWIPAIIFLALGIVSILAFGFGAIPSLALAM